MSQTSAIAIQGLNAWFLVGTLLLTTGFEGVNRVSSYSLSGLRWLARIIGLTTLIAFQPVRLLAFGSQPSPG